MVAPSGMSRLPHWSHFEHGADIGVRGEGGTLEESFEQAALALVAVITDPRRVNGVETVRIQCAAPDRELLLVDWLNALVYEMAVRDMVFGAFRVRMDNGGLTADCAGEPVARKRHQPIVEVKGATNTELRVARDNGNWIAQCVVDV